MAAISGRDFAGAMTTFMAVAWGGDGHRCEGMARRPVPAQATQQVTAKVAAKAWCGRGGARGAGRAGTGGDHHVRGPGPRPKWQQTKSSPRLSFLVKVDRETGFRPGSDDFGWVDSRRA